jgi:uncharacterized membrane protein
VSVHDIAPLERILGRLLTAGTQLSMALLAAGLVATFLRPGRASRELLAAGLWVLLLTPATRVAVSMFGYLRQRDWAFVLYTSIVLGLLVTGFVAAFAR